jgi:hypothetical protein
VISLAAFLAGSLIVVMHGVLSTVFYHDVRKFKEGSAETQARKVVSRRLQFGADAPPTD